MDNERRKRIIAIATQIVVNQRARGEIPKTDEAMKKAMPKAVQIAAAAYDAATEYLS